MVRLSGAAKAFNPVRSARQTQQGNAGYDNARENIDPQIKTQAVMSRELVADSLKGNPVTIYEAWLDNAHVADGKKIYFGDNDEAYISYNILGEFMITSGGQNISIGQGETVDKYLIFKGSSTWGSFAWDGSDDAFRFLDDVYINSGEKLYFTNVSHHISASVSDMNISSNGKVNVTTSTSGLITNNDIHAGTSDNKVMHCDHLETSGDGIIRKTVGDFWPFRYANIGVADNTGFFFDVTNSKMKFKVLNLDVVTFQATGSGNTTWGSSSNYANVILSFAGNSANTGTITWLRTYERFEFNQDIIMSGTERIYFYDTNLYIYSSTSGQLDIDASTEVEISAPTIDLRASSNLQINGTNGATGSFTTVDGKTVTVTKGIITSIV